MGSAALRALQAAPDCMAVSMDCWILLPAVGGDQFPRINCKMREPARTPCLDPSLPLPGSVSA